MKDIRPILENTPFYSKEKVQLLGAEKALRVLYNHLKVTTEFGGRVKEIFHKHMNMYTELLKQYK
jgi:hypothetical protein